MLLIGLKLQLCVQVADIMQRNGNVSIKTVFKKCQDENPVIISFIIWFKVPQMKKKKTDTLCITGFLHFPLMTAELQVTMTRTHKQCHTLKQP